MNYLSAENVKKRGEFHTYKYTISNIYDYIFMCYHLDLDFRFRFR